MENSACVVYLLCEFTDTDCHCLSANGGCSLAVKANSGRESTLIHANLAGGFTKTRRRADNSRFEEESESKHGSYG